MVFGALQLSIRHSVNMTLVQSPTAFGSESDTKFAYHLMTNEPLCMHSDYDFRSEKASRYRISGRKYF